MLKNCIMTLGFILVNMTTFAQQLNVTVRSNDGKSLQGATIDLQQKTKATNAQGHATFEQLEPKQSVINVSFIGYASYNDVIDLREQTSLEIELQAKTQHTGDVHVSATRASVNTATTYKNLTKQDLNKQNLGQDLPYLLDQTPSVVVSSDAGAGIGYTNITIRGSNNQRINVTLNGIPLNDAESMGSFFVNLPDFTSNTESIQIQRGIGTSTNGAGAFGASLNIQTDEIDSLPSAEINNTFGSYNTWKNTVKVGTGLTKTNLAFNARLSRISSDGYIDRASSDLKSFYFDGGYYGEKHQLKATIFSGKEKTYQAWDGVPQEMLPINRRYNGFEYENQTDNYTQTHHHLHYSYYASPYTTINAALHYTRGSGYYEELKTEQKFDAYGLKPIIIGESLINTTDLIRRRWLDNHFYGAVFSILHKFNAKHALTIGGAANQYRGDHYGEIIWAEYASNSKIGDKYYFNDAQKNDVNIYGKWNASLGKINLYTDLQYRFVDYTFEGYNHNQELADVNVKHHFFNPKIGTTYSISPRMNLYASYAYANKEPVRDDYVESTVNARPKAEKMHDIEVGYRWNNEKFHLGTNAYAMLYKDQLILTGEINDVGGSIRENVPESYRIGFEFDGSWSISPRILWKATAGISDNKIKNYREYLTVMDENWVEIDAPQVVNEYKSTTISFSPSTVLSSELSYTPIAPLEISFASKYVSRQYLDNTTSSQRSIDPFFVNNLRFRYSFSIWKLKNIEANLAINNIFNEKYEANGYTYGGITPQNTRLYGNAYYPQAETNFLLGLNLQF